MKESGTGTVREPEMVALDKVIAQINEMSPVITRIGVCATSSPTSRTVWKKARPCNNRPRTNSLSQFSASPDLHSEFVTVIGAMDSSADLSAQILNNLGLVGPGCELSLDGAVSQKLLGELVPLVYRTLKATA